jgi:hypothetical protein
MPTFLHEVSPELLKTTAPLTKKSTLLTGAVAVPVRNAEVKMNDFRSTTPVVLSQNSDLLLGLPCLSSEGKVGFHNSPVKPARVKLKVAPAGCFTAPCALPRNAD